MSNMISVDDARKLGYYLSVIFLSPLIISWLWNMIVVHKFGLPRLSYWESMGLMFVVHNLFPARRWIKIDKD